jgi:hypothetical protein
VKYVLGAAALAVLLLHLTSLPLTIWEYDESLFSMGVEHFDPLHHFPPPPGYPLFIGTAKLVLPLVGDPFRTLVALNAFMTVAGFLLLAMAFRAIAGDTRVGVLGAFLFYASPAMLVHASLALSDSGGLALLALSLWLCARAIKDVEHPRRTLLIAFAAIACSACVGWRPQFAIAIVPMFFTTVALLRTWRERFVAVQWFAIACAAWLLALIGFTGGFESFWLWLSGQAVYFAQHDADLSRTGQSAGQIALRFIAHPWGPKWLAAPVLLFAAIGLVDAASRRLWIVLPAVVMSVVYLAFALRMMDPADGVRYALPAHLAIALLAILGIDLLRRMSGGVLADWALLGLYAAGSYIYAGPILRQRAESPSPPVAAIRYLRSIAPGNAVILYDLPLKPHAQYLLRGYTRLRVDEGLLRFGHRIDRPIFELTDSATTTPGGKVFRWNTPDAYSKLTRNHYGAVSVLPMPVTERFLAVSGISAPERASTGSWRWIGSRGTIALPDVGARAVRLTFAVPDDYPLASNHVVVNVEGSGSAEAEVTRGKASVVELLLPGGAARLQIAAARTFVPANVPGRLSRDRRTLSVMLTKVEQVTGAWQSPRAGSPPRG